MRQYRKAAIRKAPSLRAKRSNLRALPSRLSAKKHGEIRPDGFRQALWRTASSAEKHGGLPACLPAGRLTMTGGSMKYNSTHKIIVISAGLLACVILVPRWLNHGLDGRLAVRVITAEAANQNLWSMIGVGEVIRHRGAIQGFSVLKKDVDAFYRKESPQIRRQAQTAWLFSRLTNLTQGATHFENVRQFGPPPWEREMKKTIRLGDLQFYKRKL